MGAIQDHIDRLAESLQRSVAVDDPAIRLLYTSAHFGDEDDVRRHAVLQRDAGDETIAYVLSQGVGDWTKPGTIAANDAIGLRSRYCVPIRFQGALLGFVMVMGDEDSLSPEEIARIATATDELAGLLLEERHDTSHETQQLLREHFADLRSGNAALRQAAVRAIAGQLEFGEGEHLAAIAIRASVSRGEASPSHASAALLRALRGVRELPAGWRTVHSTSSHEAVVVVASAIELSGERLLQFANELVDQAQRISAGTFVSFAGISAVHRGIEHLPAALAQSDIAAERSRLNIEAESAGGAIGGVRVAEWNSLGADAVLLRLATASASQRAIDAELLPHEVQLLLAHDADGTSVATVLAFLEHAGSAPDAAKALHIHRTTLYYRLGRIREATGLDLDDGQTRFALQLGLRLVQLQHLQQL